MTQQLYRKSHLDNGITVVTERLPYVRSISLGVWIKTGTRFEQQENNGVAHFLEHMMFKGTARRQPRDVARSLESLGGQLNAFTGKEQTCFYVEILDEHLKPAIDVLADILCHSTFPQAEIEKEREVILEEIRALEDMPDELVQDYFVERLFPGHSLGYQILGSVDTVSELNREDIVTFYNSYYHCGNIVIAAAGNVDHEELLELCNRHFVFPVGGAHPEFSPPQEKASGDVIIEMPIHQTHICLGLPGLAYADPRRMDLLILNSILGNGMGSRLFQNVREKHGLAYGIYSFLDFFHDEGILGIYVGVPKKKYDFALDLLRSELHQLVSDPVDAVELSEAKSQLKGNIVLGLESSANRMNRLAMMEIYRGTYVTLDDAIRRIEGVTAENLFRTAEEVVRSERLLNVTLIPGEDGSGTATRYQ